MNAVVVVTLWSQCIQIHAHRVSSGSLRPDCTSPVFSSAILPISPYMQARLFQRASIKRNTQPKRQRINITKRNTHGKRNPAVFKMGIVGTVHKKEQTQINRSENVLRWITMARSNGYVLILAGIVLILRVWITTFLVKNLIRILFVCLCAGVKDDGDLESSFFRMITARLLSCKGRSERQWTSGR